MKKIFWFALVVIVLLLGGYGWYEYTRENKHLKSARAEVDITAPALIASYSKDSVQANKNFTEKIILVKGEVSEVDSSANPVIIFLKAESGMSTVKCSMDPLYQSKYQNVAKGNYVHIKGICVGAQILDFGLGTDVSLKRCILESKK